MAKGAERQPSRVALELAEQAAQYRRYGGLLVDFGASPVIQDIARLPSDPQEIDTILRSLIRDALHGNQRTDYPLPALQAHVEQLVKEVVSKTESTS